MLQRSTQLPSWWEVANDRTQIRWNRTLSKAFDVASEQFPPASLEEGLVSKYLGVDIKHLERRSSQIPSVRMGAFLTAVDREMESGSPLSGKSDGWRVDDIRNLDYKGEETPPVYNVIQLNSTKSADFLIDGMRFLRQGDEKTGVRATLRVQPRWWGMQVTAYGLRAAGTAQMLLSRIHGLAKEINFLKGEAFSLSGEFLPKTGETFSDLFLDPTNALAVERIVRLINEKGKALENRGVILMGPPGTGKTLAARIVRNEAKATFIWVSARDFHYSGSFGGFADAFELARECAPSVIVFEDVDNWLYDTTVDLIKTEMDGVSKSSGVVTMMTTNYPELLPAALIDRPGRFHDVLKFDLPDAAARKQMLLRWIPKVPAPELETAVKSTEGYSGAHIRELARFANIIAEQDGLPIGKALLAALKKLAEQRDLITQTQRGRAYHRMPTELIDKVGVRVARQTVGATKTFDHHNRAFSTITVKSVDDERRIITGVATTPRPDRIGDVIEPDGVEFEQDVPLLLFHDTTKPVGRVRFHPPTAEGVGFTATMPRIDEAGTLRDRVDEAWQSIKARLLSKVSIGFKAIDGAVERIKDGGLRFLKTELLELSLVAIPMNPDAVIQTIKSLSAQDHAALGTGPHGNSTKSAGVAATVKGTKMAKTITEQLTAFEATRQAKSARMTEIMQASADEGVTLDAAQTEEYDGLEKEVKSVDDHLVRLRRLEEVNKAAAKPANGSNQEEASRSRGTEHHVISVKSNVPPGIDFARAVICKMNSYLYHEPAYEIAKRYYPDNQRIHTYLKATVAAGTTTDANWASALVDQTNLASEFIEFLRPQTIVGKFGTGNIPSLRRVPFNVRMVGQTTGGTANWVGQAKPKPLTKFHFEATTLAWAKIAAISVIADELARFSVPGAETLVRDALSETIVEKMDTDFIDPAVAAVSNVSPASITNGVVPLATAGTSADNVRTDIQNLLEQFILNNMRVAGLVLIMPETLALAASIMVNSLGQREFPDLNVNGGSILGIPVITSQYAANESSSGNLLIAVNAREVFLSDDGQVTIDVSREAALEMLDTGFTQSQPTGASLVSLWQNNLLGIKAERFINWAKRRATAVSFMDDVNWGAVGSPV